MDGAGSYSVAHRAGLLPTELTGMWGWILRRSPHQGRGSPPAPAPTKQSPGHEVRVLLVISKPDAMAHNCSPQESLSPCHCDRRAMAFYASYRPSGVPWARGPGPAPPASWSPMQLHSYLTESLCAKYQQHVLVSEWLRGIVDQHVDGETMGLLQHADWMQVVPCAGPRAYVIQLVQQLASKAARCAFHRGIQAPTGCWCFRVSGSSQSLGSRTFTWWVGSGSIEPPKTGE